jgi:UTP--glucose-1-phosphate uridylyltransferase
MARVRKAVLPVAGLGTRVLPATKSTPKELLNVVDRPIISYIVAEARAAGIEHFVFVTGRGKDAIEDYFDHQVELEAQLEAKAKTQILDEILAELPKAGEMSFVRQMAPLGLGHAVWCARHLIGDEPFAVLLPDVIVDAETPCMAQLVRAFEQTGGNIIAVEAVPDSECHKYGIVTPAKSSGGQRDGRLVEIAGMVEKPRPGTAPSNLCIAGRYILRPEIFQALALHEKGAGGEIQLTDAMARLMREQPFYAYEYEGVTYDCGDKIGLLRANVALALKRPDLGDAARAALRPLFEKV